MEKEKESRLKVGILTTSFPAYKGHVQSPFIWELAKALQKHVDVKVICPFYEESESKIESWDGVEIRRFIDPKKLTSGGGIPSNLKSSHILNIFKLTSFLWNFYLTTKKECQDCDILHAQWALSAIVGALIKRKNQKLMLTTRGAALNLALKSFFMKKVLMYALRRCSYLIPNNNNHKEILEKLGFSNVQTIPNGIDINKFKKRNQFTMRKKLNLPKDKKIILFVGWLIPRKGCKYLLKAMQIILQKEKDINLLIIGEGIMENQLKILAKELQIGAHVQFLGKKSPDEIPFWMNAADILVLPSLSEGKPNVVGEAMASQLPVIATNVNGTPDFVNDNKTGFLVPPENPMMLAEKINLLLRNKRLRAAVGKRARASILEKGLTWGECAKSYAAIYKSFK